MLWEVEIRPLGRDGERERVCDEFDLLTHAERGGDLVSAAARGFLLEGDLDRRRPAAARRTSCSSIRSSRPATRPRHRRPRTGDYYTVLLKPGVMDPVAQSVLDAADDPRACRSTAVRTFRRYFGTAGLPLADRDVLFRKVLANDAIEQVVVGPLQARPPRPRHAVHASSSSPCRCATGRRRPGEAEPGRAARAHLDEMQAIQAHFRELGREPTDVELETIAQTWSEHCSHKTLKGTIDFTTSDGETRTYENLLKETIFGATQEIRQQLGRRRLVRQRLRGQRRRRHVRRPATTSASRSRRTTTPRPSSPTAGPTPASAASSATRSAPAWGQADLQHRRLLLRPARHAAGVAAAGRAAPAQGDAGRRRRRARLRQPHGHPDGQRRRLLRRALPRQSAGLLRHGRPDPGRQAHSRRRKPGDLIVAVGGRTGRDGIHGATFSSVELTHESEKVSGGAVQIGNAITEKKVLDVLLQARDRGLYHAITDCGAGGFSSAVGEMGEKLGAAVAARQGAAEVRGAVVHRDLDLARRRSGWSWPCRRSKWDELRSAVRSEDVEATVLGTFEPTGRLQLHYQGEQVADLDMHFLHDGRPAVVRQATWTAAEPRADAARAAREHADLTDDAAQDPLRTQRLQQGVDHPPVRPRGAGRQRRQAAGRRRTTTAPATRPSSTPVLGSWAGLAIGCGINPRYGDLDPYAMAAARDRRGGAQRRRRRGRPARIAILDNFCWGNTDRPGGARLAGPGRRGVPRRGPGVRHAVHQRQGQPQQRIPRRRASGSSSRRRCSIRALGRVPDVRQCVTMDLKEAGQRPLPRRRDEGRTGRLALPPRHGADRRRRCRRSIWSWPRKCSRRCTRRSRDGLGPGVPRPERRRAGGGRRGDGVRRRRRRRRHRRCPATVCGRGAAVQRIADAVPGRGRSRSTRRRSRRASPGCRCAKVGTTVKEPRLRIAGASGEWLIWVKLAELKEAWQKPLRW